MSYSETVKRYYRIVWVTVNGRRTELTVFDTLRAAKKQAKSRMMDLDLLHIQIREGDEPYDIVSEKGYFKYNFVNCF